MFWILSVATSSDFPNVVSSCIMTASSPVFVTITGIVSSAKLNKTWSPLTSLSTLNRSCGSNTAANSIGGRFHPGMWAGMIIEWPAGIQTLSVETILKTGSVCMLYTLWYNGTKVSSFTRNFFCEKSGSPWWSSKKSRPIKQSASDLAKTWNLCSNFLPPKLMGRRTTPRVSMGNWFAAFSCLSAGSNFKEWFSLRES